MVTSLLGQIGIIILFAALLALITKLLKQPIVLGYVIAGFLIGPLYFKFITSTDLIQPLADLGVAFLLFIVGLELDINKFKQLGWVIAVTGVLQVLLVTAVSAFIAGIWLSKIEALYLGLIIAFSSTMIVIKLIEDKNELQTLHGKIVLGILLVQDILVVLALSLLKNIGVSSPIPAVLSIGKGLGLIIISYFIGKYIFNFVLKISASIPELLFMVSLAISFVYAYIASLLGFSIAIGAFIAGIALASSPFSIEIIGRVKSLKDFFLVIFFVSLGLQITSLNLGSIFMLLIVSLLLVVLLKPLIIFILLKLFKQSNRTAFSSSFSLAQISEFSLVLASTGIVLGHIHNNLFTLSVIVGAITITITSYLIKYDRNIYSLIFPLMKRIETSPKEFGSEKLDEELNNHIVVIGAHRMASRIIEILKQKHKNFVVVDFNPERVSELRRENITCIYGDYGNVHVLGTLNISKAKIVISTVPNLNDNLRLIKMSKEFNKNIIVIVATHNAFDALLLYKDGADFVIFPEYLSGQKIADYLVHLDNKGIKKWGQHYKSTLVDEIKRNRLFI